MRLASGYTGRFEVSMRSGPLTVLRSGKILAMSVTLGTHD